MICPDQANIVEANRTTDPRREEGVTDVGAVVSAVRRVLRNDTITASDDLMTVGASSLDLVELAIQLSAMLSREVELNDIWNARTISALMSETGTTPPVVAQFDDEPAGSGFRRASPQQRRFHAVHQPAITSLSEVVSCQISLPRGCSISLLRDALRSMVIKYDALRMTFEPSDTGLRQIDHHDLEFDLIEIDLGAAAHGTHGLTEILRSEAAVLYDPRQWPLFRCHLVRASDQDIVLFHVYHLVFDGASRLYFESELRATVDRLMQGGSLPQETLYFNYSDYTNWANRRMAQPAYSQAKSYWTGVFKDDFRPFHLSSIDETAVLDTNAAGYVFSLGVPASRQVAELAIARETTEFTVMLTVFLAYLLQSYDGIAVAVPTQGRNHPLAQQLIGLFQNTVVIRAWKSESDKLTSFLQTIHRRVIEAQVHQEFQYDEIVRSLGLSFPLNRLPLTGVYFNNVTEKLRVPPGERGNHYVLGSRVKTDLMANYQRIGDEIVCNFKYRRCAFTDREIDGFCAEYRRFAASYAAGR